MRLDRHSKGVTISRPLEPQLFYRHQPATYALLEWLPEEQKNDLDMEQRAAEEERELALDTSLFLEQEWHKWLYHDLIENGLVDFGLGRLGLHQPTEQESKHGRFNTGVVGEIDLLLRTENGGFVVVELKRKGDDETVGQICRYVGWVSKHLAGEGENVHGIIVTPKISDRLRYAIKAVKSNIHYQQVILSVSFGERS